MTVNRKLTLRPGVVPQPLIHRWYAWPYLIAPHTGALNLRDRLIPTMRSYLDGPQLHASALANPARYGGPFINPGDAGVAEVERLLEQTLRAGRAKLTFADDLNALRQMLHERARGGSMEGLYPEVPASLKGTVELVYDTAHRPSVRFFEPLLYRTAAFEPHSQTVSLSPRSRRHQPFVYGSPVLAGPDRLDIAVPFASAVWDDLFAARLTAIDVQELAERLELDTRARQQFAALFQDEEPPAPPARPDPGTVRMRYFNHATVLLETESSAVLLDPLLGYPDDGFEHLTLADLPAYIDTVVISHFHSDHFSLETLLQLRRRVGTIVVPRSSGGSLQDPSLKTMLQALGFDRVRELGELETFAVGEGVDVVALPFIGEHADLDIRTKMVPLVRALGRSFMFATDITPIEPALYELVRDVVGTVDALFVGLECVGAPLSWLYGPLMESRLPREQDQTRRLKGSDAAMADRLAQQVGAAHVYAYAMGLEPWLKHLTGSDFDPESEPVRQSVLLGDLCGRRGVGAELLYLGGERVWSAKA
ncbi:MBL fold metallo-hydrolase [Micromonospora sp. NPDC000663]|uniref:MBL fold metallo-hydrolase n=1 Tax=Micromonospora sp. NPDC000663 TaxID=3364218 RepID=UPI0036CE313E